MKQIKKLRNELGLTQLKFAEKIGVQRQTIAQYETGARTPSQQVILAICREFGVREEWLRDGKGEILADQSAMTLDEYAKQKKARPIEKELFKAFLEMEPETRDTFIEAIRNVFYPEFQEERAKTGKPPLQEIVGIKPEPYKPKNRTANPGDAAWGKGHAEDVEMFRKSIGRS